MEVLLDLVRTGGMIVCPVLFISGAVFLAVRLGPARVSYATVRHWSRRGLIGPSEPLAEELVISAEFDAWPTDGAAEQAIPEPYDTIPSVEHLVLLTGGRWERPLPPLIDQIPTPLGSLSSHPSDPRFFADVLDWPASRCCVYASAVAHIIVLCLLVCLTIDGTAGAGGLSGDAIRVKLIEQEAVTPEDESPGSVDSAASSPSVANRVKRADERRSKEALRKAEQHHDPHPEGNRPASVETRIRTDTREGEATGEPPGETRAADKRPAVPDEMTFRSESNADSPASVPSVASPERLVISAPGEEGEDFKSRVFSAIKEAVYFPRKALSKGQHGESVATFTVSRDGSLSHVAIAQSSGSDLLDEAALTIIRNASKKFPPFPAAFKGDSLSYVVPIVFKEKRVEK